MLLMNVFFSYDLLLHVAYLVVCLSLACYMILRSVSLVTLSAVMTLETEKTYCLVSYEKAINLEMVSYEKAINLETGW